MAQTVLIGSARPATTTTQGGASSRLSFTQIALLAAIGLGMLLAAAQALVQTRQDIDWSGEPTAQVAQFGD